MNYSINSKGTPQSISTNPQLMNVISTVNKNHEDEDKSVNGNSRRSLIIRDDDQTVQSLHSFHTFPVKSTITDDENDTCVQSVKSFPVKPSMSPQVGGNGYYLQQSNQATTAYNLQSKGQHYDSSLNNNSHHKYDMSLKSANGSMGGDYDYQHFIENQQQGAINMRRSDLVGHHDGGLDGSRHSQKSRLRNPLSLEDVDIENQSRGSKGSRGSNDSGKSRRFSMKRPNMSFGSNSLDHSSHGGDNNNSNLNRIHKR